MRRGADVLGGLFHLVALPCFFVEGKGLTPIKIRGDGRPYLSVWGRYFTKGELMKLTWTDMASGLAILAMTGIGAAQTTSPQMPAVEKRQEIQQKRMEKGVESGALTKKEAARLQKRQGKIEADQQKALSDGKVTKRERGKLHREQDRASKQIYKEKHDRQRVKKAE